MDVTLEGAKELERILKTMEPKLAKKEVRKAVRAGAKEVLKKAKAGVPVDSGRLKRSLTIMSAGRRVSKKGQYSLSVLPSTKKEPGLVTYTKEGKRYYYPAVLEYGTKDRPPHPWFRRSWDSVKNPSLKTIMNALRAGLEKVARQK